MRQSQFGLLETRRFLPLFITQALGAFNDNVYKNALVILITFVLAEKSNVDAQLMVTAAAGIFIFPFFLFSATAGQLADKYDKAALIRILKMTELALMFFASLGFYLQSTSFLMALLFLMGTQSAFFGPLKYGILPDHLKSDELISGNALIQAATFLAILLGTVVGGILILSANGTFIISLLIIAAAFSGWLSSRYIPSTQPADSTLQVNLNVFTETWKILNSAAQHRDIFLSILGVSWFWLVGATFLAQFPTFGKEVLGGDQTVVTFLLIVFSLGIGIGSLFCNKMLKGSIHATYVPLGALGITLFSIDLFFASHSVVTVTGNELVGVSQLLSSFTGWRISVDLLLIAVSGGIYIVPLTALIQHRSDPSHRARNIAANNIMNAIFMVVSAVGTALLLTVGFTVPEVFLTIAALNAVVAFYITRLLPGALVKSLIVWLLETIYRVEVEGLKHCSEAGNKVLIVSNHQSFLDALLIAAFAPSELTFAINTYVARHRLLRFFLSLSKTFPLDPANPLSTRALIDAIKKNEKVVLFPEGRITVTGSLMKVYEGAGLIADKSGATILPVRIDGAQYSPFSRLKGKVRIRLFPKIRITFMPPRSFDVPSTLKGRARRQHAGKMLYDLMTDMIFASSQYHKTLFSSLLDAREIHGSRHGVLEDIGRNPVSYGRMITGSFVLGNKIAQQTQAGEIVGLLLPNTTVTAITFFAIQAYGRVPAMLNYSTGAANVVSSCGTAKLKIVYTSRRFVEMGQLESLVADIAATGIRLEYLEDVRQSVSFTNKFIGLIYSRIPRIAYYFTDRNRDPKSPCVILFTSGTEGVPKAVVLSHANIQANRSQVSTCIDFGPTDIVFNALPMFHSFGLTCGTLLPILSGLKVFLYPSPLHYRIVPELVYETNATILFGTDTFFAGYARLAHPYDFYSVRYAFSGAEKLKEETRQVWGEKFGVRIFEGYGATETAPVLSMNSPMQNRRGSVGRLMPGIKYRLDKIPGIEDGSRLWVSGPNIMMGYLLANNPGELCKLKDGWYDTGDIVDVDDEGFIFIKGRAKRFAKIGGEMISLGAIEDLVGRLWPDFKHVVVAIADEKRGEQLILLTENPTATREEFTTYAKNEGAPLISLPKTILTIEKIPLLGAGKTDFVSAKKIAEKQVG